MEQPQGHAIRFPTTSSPLSDHEFDHVEDHPDLSPVGSPELTESHFPPPLDQTLPSVLSDDLRRKIIKQVEYYFSDENLPNDKFLLKYVTRNAEGFVPIGVVASFRKMKKLTRDTSWIVDALKESAILVVSSNGKKVKRLHPLPLAEIKDPMVCTVLVENLPEDHSVENLRQMFGEAGNIMNITIRDPHDVRDPKKCTIAEKLISGKLHALVEYETVEAAEKAVSTLNNEQDWRYGLRVKLLKKMNKPGQKKKNWREPEHDKGSTVQATEPAANQENHDAAEHPDDSHDEEDVDHLSRDKNGAHLAKDKNGPKGRNRGRGRRQKYQGANGHGICHGAQYSSHGVEPSKPPPGPRMPDGTRGFTMGRGRPLATGRRVARPSRSIEPFGDFEAAVNSFPLWKKKKNSLAVADDRFSEWIVMQSHALCAANCTNLNHVGFLAPFSCFRFPTSRLPFDSAASYADHKLFESRTRSHGFRVRSRALRICAMDDDFGASFGDWGNSEYMFSSSEGDDSDGDVFLQPITDVDLPTSKERLLPSDDSITVTAHRLATLGSPRKRRKTVYGILNNVGLMVFSTFLLLLVDLCAWRIVRLPLAPFYLMRPFLISAVLVSCAGYICVPLFRMFNMRSMVRKRAPSQHSSKKGTPTMGGLYFVPIGLLVAEAVLKFSSIEVSGAAAVTMAFAAIGLLDDFLSIRYKNDGLSGWIRILLEAAIGAWFSYWLCTTDISTPYNMKTVVPLPGPLGLICLGKFYPVLTSFCFVSMANGVNLTDGLDGLAAGTAALAFIGMSIVVLPICSDLSIFGAAMAGACVGFLFQNQHKASIFMGDTGALALGGALAAMASCTGMFFPLFISSGIYVVEALSVIIQLTSVLLQHERPRRVVVVG
ncbi:translocase 11 [Perilla frutescens var. frutescens]|nr:translocase 11 [Perilla frutescens var. frutescens]